MNEWAIAATVLAFALLPCVLVCLLAPAPHGLVALEIAGVLATSHRDDDGKL